MLQHILCETEGKGGGGLSLIHILMSRFSTVPIVPLYLICQLADIIKCVIGFVLVKKGVWIQNFVEMCIRDTHTPLTEENHYLINKESLAEMKDGVVIINTARGALIESEALIAGIESGKVGAAALDVVEKEFGLYYYDRKSDVLDNRELAILRGFPNVTVSHHMALYTDNYTRTVSYTHLVPNSPNR